MGHIGLRTIVGFSFFMIVGGVWSLQQGSRNEYRTCFWVYFRPLSGVKKEVRSDSLQIEQHGLEFVLQLTAANCFMSNAVWYGSELSIYLPGRLGILFDTPRLPGNGLLPLLQIGRIIQ